MEFHCLKVDTPTYLLRSDCKLLIFHWYVFKRILVESLNSRLKLVKSLFFSFYDLNHNKNTKTSQVLLNQYYFTHEYASSWQSWIHLILFKSVYMKHPNTRKILRVLLVLACLSFSLLIGLVISINFIVDPIIYWLASTEIARIFIGCILSWLGVSTSFDLFYKRYKRRKKIARFNALNVPYPRTFKGRKR